jgi:hypothetical protein
VDRIGIAGQFTRGPVSPAIVSQNTAKNIFGFDTAVGSAHLQAAIDQGANDFVVARAMAVARKARKDTTIVGTVVGNGSLKLYLKDGGTIVEVTLPLTAGQTGSQVAAALTAAVIAANNAKFTAEVGAGSATTNGKLNVVAKAGGVAGNSLQFKYELLTSTGLTFGPGDLTVYTSLAAGEDGPKAAKVMLLNAASQDVLELELNWPGALGNTVTAVVEEGSETNLRDLIISFPGSGMPDEVFRDLDLTDVVIQRYNSGEGREAGDGAAGGGGAAAGGGGGGAGAGSGGAGSGGAGGGGAGGGRAGGGAGRATKAGGGG